MTMRSVYGPARRASTIMRAMLPRWIESLLTPCPRHLREMGYLRELLNVRACHARCCWAWGPHLRRTQAVIRAAAARCRTRRKAVVLGSGMLNDVPLAELAAAFREVVLVDVLHPRETHRLTRRWPNVRLLTADVTGTVEAVHRAAHDGTAPLPRAVPDLFRDDREVDLAASVNLLSQLPYLPATYLTAAGAHSPEAIAAYARDVVLGHLAYLESLPGVVALVTDVENLTMNHAGQEVERSSVLHGVALPWAGETWTWRLLPELEAGRGQGLRRRVVGIVNVKDCARTV